VARIRTCISAPADVLKSAVFPVAICSADHATLTATTSWDSSIAHLTYRPQRGYWSLTPQGRSRVTLFHAVAFPQRRKMRLDTRPLLNNDDSLVSDHAIIALPNCSRRIPQCLTLLAGRTPLSSRASHQHHITRFSATPSFTLQTAPDRCCLSLRSVRPRETGRVANTIAHFFLSSFCLLRRALPDVWLSLAAPIGRALSLADHPRSGDDATWPDVETPLNRRSNRTGISRCSRPLSQFVYAGPHFAANGPASRRPEHGPTTI